MKKGTELELKLGAPDGETLALVEADEVFAGCKAEKLLLSAEYYDFADGRLKNKRASLRFRRENGEGKVTLKTDGKSSLGVFSRTEWETSARDIFEGISILRREGASDILGNGTDEPVLRTRSEFVRRELYCSYGGAELCMAFDCGWLGGEDNLFWEVEAELVSGDPGAPEALGEYLRKKYSLFYLRESKRARCEAYRLLHKGEHPDTNFD